MSDESDTALCRKWNILFYQVIVKRGTHLRENRLKRKKNVYSKKELKQHPQKEKRKKWRKEVSSIY